MGTLVLLRHGQSQWNLENKFAGWSDDPPLLTERGKQDAVVTAGYLKEFRFDVAFTSRLKRANQTLDAVLRETNQQQVKTEYDSALNERHYGDLQGLNRAEMAKKFGDEQVHKWRRGFSDRPPNGESIEDCVHRVTPFFLQYILPLVHAGKCVLVAAHGNSLRPMLRYLDKLSDDQTAILEVPLCTPYIFTFDGPTLKSREMREIPGIVTLGGSTTQATVEQGRV